MGDVIAARFDRDVVRVHGPDATTFLQGQLSQDVAALPDGTSAWSLLLDPGGKLAAWVRVTRVGPEEMLIDVDAGWADAVVARLSRFRIRVACEIDEVPGWQMVSVRGAAAPDGDAAGTLVLPAPGRTIGVVGYDLLGVDPLEPDGIVVDEDAVEQARVRSGVPRMGAELDDTVIPAEVGRWFVEEGVSWTKGCYTGQELVARVDSRGSNTPRRLRHVVLTGPAAAGDEVVVDGATVGSLTSVFGELGLARIARSVTPPAAATVNGRAATVTEIGSADDGQANGEGGAGAGS